MKCFHLFEKMDIHTKGKSMKFKNLLVVSFAVIAFPVLALAHGNKIDITGDGIAAALKKFETEETSHAANFSGVKGWMDADKIMVKVYLSDNSAITYTCTMMEMNGGDDMFTCVK